MHDRLICEYFYNRMCELEDKELELVRAMRTKKGLIVLCDQLRELEVEKAVLHRVYTDLRHFI